MYRNDETIKPRWKKLGYQGDSPTTSDVVFEPDIADIKVTVLKTLQITSNKPRVPGICFTEPSDIEGIVLEYTIGHANCPFMCACKGNKDEIAPLWKDVETLNNRGVELYILLKAVTLVAMICSPAL